MEGSATINFNEILINGVREHDNLYNKSSKDYQNKLMREGSWAKVAEQCQKTVKECQQRWKHLRERFVKEKHAMEGRSGSGATPQKKCWPFFEAMQFLLEHVECRRTVDNEETIEIGEDVFTSPTSSSSTSSQRTSNKSVKVSALLPRLDDSLSRLNAAIEATTTSNFNEMDMLQGILQGVPAAERAFFIQECCEKALELRRSFLHNQF